MFSLFSDRSVMSYRHSMYIATGSVYTVYDDVEEMVFASTALGAINFILRFVLC